MNKALEALETIHADLINYRALMDDSSYSTDEDYELVLQDILTLRFIKSVWLSEQVSEKETIEKITEMLFSGNKWVTNKEEEQE